MRNHIIIKFIAIFLCAAALFGVLASGFGIIVLTENDLYDRTVEQMHADELDHLGQLFANSTANYYSDINLGGSPQELANKNYYHNPLCGGYYTYDLKDPDGNILESGGAINTDETTTLSFPVSGKYIHVVSVTPESQLYAPTETTELLIPCTGMALDSGPFELVHGGALALEVDVEPEDTTDQIRYYSLNESIATVDETGLITAVTEGQTKVIVTCGNFTNEIGVSVAAPPTEATDPETVPATEPFVYDAWDDETWERIQDWIQEEWSKDTWENDQWDALAAWADENWKEDQWNDAQWAQLEHWIVTEWNKEEPAETTAPETVPETVPETQPPTVPAETVPDLTVADSSPAEPPAATGEPVSSENTAPILINGRPLSDFEVYTETYYDGEIEDNMVVKYVMLDMPAYTVDLHLADGALNMDPYLPILRVLRAYRNLLIPAMAVCLLLFGMFGVYLCCAAGRKPKSDEVRAGGLNRVPLELYTGFTFVSFALVVQFIIEGGDYLLRHNLSVGFAFISAVAYAGCLVIVGFFFALIAQLKTPGRFWLTNSLCGHCWRIAVWMWNKLFPLCLRLAKWLWQVGVQCLRFCWNLARRWLNWCWKKLCAFGRWLEKLYAMLPLIWQWLLIGSGLILIPLFFTAMEAEVLLLLVIPLNAALIIYGALAFGTLLDGTKRMSKGDLNTKVDDSRLIGAFKDFAHNLNALAGVALVAAQKQLKSERMKTELITNVSHDIKTPLTSIINYVDLLQKAQTEEEREQYLEVLDRQSQQLKKLIEDLIEMSKASTGNMTVDIGLMDAVEAVNQALGEFSDKLDRAMLTPVFRHSEEPAPMMADGKLVWRVLHNLLSNAVKYALPGTRLYVDLMQVEGKVILSMKNVSREELNIDADELMERFVRGDGSRNTEGSGLGLNIAKSMMELQGGQLELLVDGDLFKVTLIFPGV